MTLVGKKIGKNWERKKDETIFFQVVKKNEE
jgi:hypothetical protein